MAIALLIVSYLAAIIFSSAIVIQVLRWKRMPMHLRWELYPVPGEASAKTAYGGSHFENLNWWRKPRKKNLLGELKAMIPEMVFMVALWRHNRKLWLRSFPFHFGLYVLAAFIVLEAACGVAVVAEVTIPFIAVTVIAKIGWAGMALALTGAVLLLSRRLSDKDLKDFTSPSQIFDLLFFVVALILFARSGIFQNPTFSDVGYYFAGLFTADSSRMPSGLLGVSILLAAVLIAYIPLTFMLHFAAKYFFYHVIRWEDEEAYKNEELQKQILHALQFKMSWSAPHIGGKGRTWAEVASDKMKEP